MSRFIEQHIIDLLKSKDQRGMTLLYDHHGPALYGCALKLTKDRDAANDILQDALIKIWKNIDSYDSSKSKFFTWIYGITRNTTIDYLRKVQKKQLKEIQLQDRDVYSKEELVNQEDKDHINNQISKLEIKYQEVLDAVFYKGMTHVEAASYLNLPLGTFKTRVRNALKELRTINKALIFLILGVLNL